MSERKGFDPAKHLTLVSGREYLESKWRLVWLRTDAPNSTIETELLQHENNFAVFKAVVTKIGDNGEVLGMATGHACEDKQGFGAYLEKAETAAISRALAALGYGTQFSRDFDDAERIADAPVARNSSAPVQFRQDNAGNFRSEPQQQRPSGGYDTAATDRQNNLISSLARDLKMTRQDLDATAQEVTGSPLDGLTRRNASTLIESLKERAQSRTGGTA